MFFDKFCDKVISSPNIFILVSEFWVLVILAHDWLSHHSLNLETRRISNSQIIDRTQILSLVVSVAAIYLASIEDRATMACFFVYHTIAHPTKVNKNPNVE